MRARKSLLQYLSVRARSFRRWLHRSRAGRHVNSAPRRAARWWSIYSLRFSWGLFFLECASATCLLSLAALSYLVISHFVFQSVQVQGPSMYPTLVNSNIYWLNRFAYELHDPRPGDIVAIKDPSGQGFDVKRIIAVPRQSVFIKHGHVYINGRLLRESYLPCHMRTFAYEEQPDELWCLAPGQFFVMGDNRGNSCDSRTFGPVNRGLILGRVIR